MGQTGFAERRRAAEGADAPRVTTGDAPIQSAADEHAAVVEIERQLQEARDNYEAVLKAAGIDKLEDGKPANGVEISAETLAEIEVAEGAVHGLEGALTHAQEAERIAQGGKVDGSNEQTSASAHGTGETAQTQGDGSGSTGVPTSTPQATPGEVDLSKSTRAELDDIAKRVHGLDTSKLPNKPAVIAAISAGKLPE